MSEIQEITIVVKWSAKEYPITDLTDQDTVAVLRHEIFKKTQVRPNRQKLLNLKYKDCGAGTRCQQQITGRRCKFTLGSLTLTTGVHRLPMIVACRGACKPAEDNLKLGHLELKANFKLMMVGSTEADIEDACQKPEDIGEIIDDLEENDTEEESLENSAIYLAKIQKRINDYSITELNPPRPDKHLLVLDIDYTLFDHRSSAESGAELMRPYLHEFLTCAYEHYDIVIWSATGMRWIEEKMKLLGVSSHSAYKIMFYLDSHAMISVHTPDRGVIDVKPLGVIWGLYPQYSPANTIMFDDIRRNFLMNPRSGLRIRPFRQAHLNRSTDKELLKLSKYLKDIAVNCKDFSKLNHRKWEHYDPRK